VLAIASRVFRPELHQVLHSHAQSLLGRALLECESSIETIWALVCLYYWKDVGDRRGYNLVGFALRMAGSAEWNKFGLSTFENLTLGSNRQKSEIEARQRRDADRVWLVLGNLDRSYVSLSGSYLLSLTISPQVKLFHKQTALCSPDG
jgi:hypothetical protein